MEVNVGKKVNSLSCAVIHDEKMTSDAWKVLIFVFVAWVFDAVDGTIYALTLPLIRTEFGLTLTHMGMIGTAFLGGATIGSFLMPVIAEKYGRRWGMVACIGVYSVFTGFVGIAQSIYHIAVARFVTGLGTGGEWPIGAAYLSEVVPTKKRGIMMGIMQSGYPIGYFLAGGIFATFMAWELDWRMCYLVMIIPAILCIPVVKGLKESPAWIKNKALGAVSAAVNQVEKKQNYAELFKPQYRKFTMIATVMHIVGGIFTWGINIWFPSAMMLDFHVDKIAAAFITMLMWGCGTFGYLAAGVLQDKFGRKKTITAYVTTALAAVIMLNYLHTLPNVPMTYLYATALVLGLSLGTHTVLITYSTEIYPSHVRTLGVGFSVGVGKIGSMLCPTLMGVIADASSVTLALLVSSAVGWLLVPAILQGPETAGKKLEDIVD